MQFYYPKLLCKRQSRRARRDQDRTLCPGWEVGADIVPRCSRQMGIVVIIEYDQPLVVALL